MPEQILVRVVSGSGRVCGPVPVVGSTPAGVAAVARISWAREETRSLGKMR